MPLQLDDLAALDAPLVDVSGVPLQLAIDATDEDALQPRHEFDTNHGRNWPTPFECAAFGSLFGRTCRRRGVG